MPHRKTQLDFIPRKWFESTSFGGEENTGKKKSYSAFVTEQKYAFDSEGFQIHSAHASAPHPEAIQRFSEKHHIQIKDSVIHSNQRSLAHASFYAHPQLETGVFSFADVFSEKSRGGGVDSTRINFYRIKAIAKSPASERRIAKLNSPHPQAIQQAHPRLTYGFAI